MIEQTIGDRLPLSPVPGIPEIRLHKAVPASRIGSILADHAETDEPPYWAYYWGGGLALARHILDQPDTVAGRDVLDLGAGSGIVGIAAMKVGARSVLAIDTDPLALVALSLNAAANGVAVATRQADMLDAPPPAVDFVLAGDLFYDARLAERTLAFLRRCREQAIGVLIGDPYRPSLPQHELRLLKEYAVDEWGVGKIGRSGVFTLA